eukprot:3793047-Prymnesium_polylepis.1
MHEHPAPPVLQCNSLRHFAAKQLERWASKAGHLNSSYETALRRKRFALEMCVLNGELWYRFNASKISKENFGICGADVCWDGDPDRLFGTLQTMFQVLQRHSVKDMCVQLNGADKTIKQSPTPSLPTLLWHYAHGDDTDPSAAGHFLWPEYDYEGWLYLAQPPTRLFREALWAHMQPWELRNDWLYYRAGRGWDMNVRPQQIRKEVVEACSNPVEVESKWVAVGTEKPANGTELNNVQLSEALKNKTAFSLPERKEFGIDALYGQHFIKSGDNYFKSAASYSWPRLDAAWTFFKD